LDRLSEAAASDTRFRVAIGDLSQSARIREVALELFGRRGVEATSLRMVAKAAGLSLGAVSHYYPSKEALARAVERYVLDLVRSSLTTDALAEGAPTAASRRQAYYLLMQENPAVATYIRRQWLSGDAEAEAFLLMERELTATEKQAFVAREFRRPPRDLDAALTLHRLIGMMPVLMAPAIKALSGIDVSTPEGLRRWHAAEFDLLGIGDSSHGDEGGGDDARTGHHDI
jgi:AcrR family transcriptional regulator